MQVQWELFRLVAVIEHIGETMNSGHYRALLRIEGQWWHTDDSCAAVAVEWSAAFERTSYLLMLVPAQTASD